MTKKVKPLLKLLNDYLVTFPDEERTVRKFIKFVEENPDCFERDFFPRHITGSAVVVDQGLKNILLNHHLKMNKWLQFGGHADGNPDILETAIRELKEETNLADFYLHPKIKGIFDLDVHRVVKWNGVPAHDHYDVRFLFVTKIDSQFTVSEESQGIKWVPIEQAKNYNSEEKFLRMINKVVSLRS